MLLRVVNGSAGTGECGQVDSLSTDEMGVLVQETVMESGEPAFQVEQQVWKGESLNRKLTQLRLGAKRLLREVPVSIPARKGQRLKQRFKG